MSEAVSFDRNGDIRVVGELTFATVPDFLLASREWFSTTEKSLAVDLSGVTKADSAGVALMVEWLKLAQAGGLALRFTNLPQQVRDLIRLTGLDSIFAQD